MKHLCLIMLLTLPMFFVVIGCSEQSGGGGETVSPLPTEVETLTTTSPLQPTTVATLSPTQRTGAAPQPSQPEEGKATLVGRVISKSDGVPMSDTAVRLAEVYRQDDEGAFVLDDAFSPSGVTDEDGYFVIENIEPREYVIVVGNVGTEYDIVTEPSGRARVWELRSNEILNLGEVEAELHP